MKTWTKLLLATSIAALAPFALAQSFPTKPVTMIVAFPPGGGSDVLGRAMAKGMQDSLGQPVIVENVVGVGGSLGVLKAANATPDGYTIMAGSPLELIYTPLGIAAAKNKPDDMRMAALVGHTNIAIAVRKDLPVNTLEEFVAYAKKADKPLSFGSTGIGSLYHLMAEKGMSAKRRCQRPARALQRLGPVPQRPDGRRDRLCRSAPGRPGAGRD